MQKADIWMPLYIGDYLADTARLTTEQHGAYLLLLMDYWRSGRLPDNDQVLAQISKLSPDAWGNAKAMLKQFFSISDGYWIHARVEKNERNNNEEQDGCKVRGYFLERNVFHDGTDERSINKKEDNCEITFFLKTK